MGANHKSMRKQLFVDPKVQGALVLRVVFYWFFCLLAIALMLLCWRIVTGPARIFYKHFDDMWFFYGPPAIASLLLLPLVIVDVLRLTNRFAGPMLRLRRAMKAAARGEQVERLEFRKDDFWRDLAEDFNTLVSRIQHQHCPPPAEGKHSPAREANSDVSIPPAVPPVASLPFPPQPAPSGR